MLLNLRNRVFSIVVQWKQINVEANDGSEKNEEKENVLRTALFGAKDATSVQMSVWIQSRSLELWNREHECCQTLCCLLCLPVKFFNVLMNMGILSNSNILCSDISVCRPGFALGISVFSNTLSRLLPDSCTAMAQRRCFERTELLPLLPPLFFGSLATEVNS